MNPVQFEQAPAKAASPGRRNFLKSAGFLSLGFTIPLLDVHSQATAPAATRQQLPGDLQQTRQLRAWIRILSAEKSVQLLVGKVELGQGILTAVVQLCADELDVDIGRVQVVSGDTMLVPNEGVTAGSFSMPNCATAVRQASAEVRAILLDLAEKFLYRRDVGFLLVGRGSDSNRLKASTKERKIDNVLFFDEIHPDEIPDLYAQCSAGIVALDPRHKSHNIPGKFLTYMQSGLPVLANINAGNDLAQMIRDEQVGQVCESNRVDDLVQFANRLLDQIESDGQMSSRCRSLFEREFAVEKTVRQIVSALSA
jgi:hypothetical protein